MALAWEGSVAHRDTAGHANVIGPGDAQWMTAASGIFHEEYHEEGLTRRGGRLHMMQLWVNLPRKDKLAPPGYQALKGSTFPNVPLARGGVVRVIAGEYEGARGPAHTFTPITMLDVNLRAGAGLDVSLPATFNALAVVAEGRVTSHGAAAAMGEPSCSPTTATGRPSPPSTTPTSSCWPGSLSTSLSSSTDPSS